MKNPNVQYYHKYVYYILEDGQEAEIRNIFRKLLCFGSLASMVMVLSPIQKTVGNLLSVVELFGIS